MIYDNILIILINHFMTTKLSNIIEDFKKEIKSQEDLSTTLLSDIHSLKEKIIYYKNMNKLLENNSKIIKLKVKNIVDTIINNQQTNKNLLSIRVETLFHNYSIMNRINLFIMNKHDSILKNLKNINQAGLEVFH